ncbi:hypothetical protein PF005_g4440 [Phytophthora fragariae]|uniref:Uncharacterized protein n=1 Tax=Phytophthora fragariae TaxID=53985 RepID=A0A6A3S5I6_9STRA|nr:hypothetical protein PF003_g5336 [Phytophthora fragariae]KAE8945690.1 hypothetical protein PF009_g4673 [Phytophthora fragariae]KAE9024351.1 hypothetical protein PF011_g3555 [Phytophthora fragariae]KAE9109401.1 hypothetical protein PF006_g20679 [Phytophthora fragariae]KAE9137942.1 hypothetical protein PF007_g1631 [Phytophthora fragariae]
MFAVGFVLRTSAVVLFELKRFGRYFVEVATEYLPKSPCRLRQKAAVSLLMLSSNGELSLLTAKGTLSLLLSAKVAVLLMLSS